MYILAQAVLLAFPNFWKNNMTTEQLVIINLIVNILTNTVTLVYYLSIASQNRKILEGQAKSVENVVKNDIKKVEEEFKKIL